MRTSFSHYQTLEWCCIWPLVFTSFPWKPTRGNIAHFWLINGKKLQTLSQAGTYIVGQKWISVIINNYWMRLSMISWIIKTEVCVICRSRRLRQIIQTWGFDNSWYHAKTEFNNCFIIHFLNNRQKKTFICWKMALFQN